METIAQFPSREIFSVLMPTMQAFVPLLMANKDAIHSIPSTSHQYGLHPRQFLDIYPSSPTSPILIFLYGGGLTRGDKILGIIPQQLVHHNVGAFFAKQGYTTVIPDYRRVNDIAENTGEDAVFPSGGEDISLVLKFLVDHEAATNKGRKRDIYIMGNSAGGLHLATFLLYEKFLEQRKRLLSGEEGLQLKGGIMLSVPCDFDGAADSRKPMLATYWPTSLSNVGAQESAANEYDPRGLLRALGRNQKREDLGIPPLLHLEGELDPEDEILDSMARFRSAWGDAFGNTDDIETIVMKGQNHISPPVALMSGDDEAEQWGHDTVAWMKRVA